jgi:hypothetical protein
MIILTDTTGKVVGNFLDTMVVTTGVTAALPTQETQVGKNATLHFDVATSTFSYVYTDRELTDAEVTASAEAEQATMFAAMVTGGLM